ncbi:hypothetical protein AUQ43_08070 [Thalassospira sp. MCCC 1A01148]|uniref:Uncharacterized protein n=1 Tax=Thalassospira profundimaris TaxID=502049 RepID=A0A367VK68_9PROT|nr:hypothetical protein AUQ43_08070 [Thalassospira sp. MCCC 1A01148]RCK25556.1 hypothetical protein TH6_02805 [Thalassospira profundimaris]
MDPAAKAFAFNRVEETFGNSIVTAVPKAAHTMFKIVLTKENGQSGNTVRTATLSHIRRTRAGYLLAETFTGLYPRLFVHPK